MGADPASRSCSAAPTSDHQHDRDPDTSDLEAAVEQMLAGRLRDPHGLLGPQVPATPCGSAAFHPEATAASVARPDGVTAMRRLNGPGSSRSTVPGGDPGLPAPLPQRRARVGAGGPVPVLADPRRDGPPPDRRGNPRPALARARRACHRAPGRLRHAFSVWAPNALGVSVVSDANFWDARTWPMRHARRLRGAGSCSAPASARAFATSSWSPAATGCASSRPIPWPGRRTIRRGPRASSSRASTDGGTAGGCAGARARP